MIVLVRKRIGLCIVIKLWVTIIFYRTVSGNIAIVRQQSLAQLR